jgi:hypothetical protein
MELSMNQEDSIVIPRFDGKKLVMIKVAEYTYKAVLEGEELNLTEVFEKIMESQAVR